jgi:hypothetical protein
VHAIRGANALIIWKIRISTYGVRENILYLQHIPDGYGFKKVSWDKLGKTKECMKT